MITIRKAEPKDVEKILFFIRELAIYEKAEHEVIATPEQIHSVLFSETAHCSALMAFWDDECVGFALYFFNFSTWLGLPGLYLEDLYVTPEARRNGIGKALLQQLALIAKERNCGRFEWSVLDWNQPAIDFYESLSAEAQSEWTIYRLDKSGIEHLAESIKD